MLLLVQVSHHVDVFQWERECFIIWIVKASNEVLRGVDRSILHSWTTNLLFCFPHCRFLRFQRHLLARDFPPLSMVVLDDWEVLKFRLHAENRTSHFREYPRFLNLLA